MSLKTSWVWDRSEVQGGSAIGIVASKPSWFGSTSTWLSYSSCSLMSSLTPGISLLLERPWDRSLFFFFFFQDRDATKPLGLRRSVSE